MLHPSGDRGQDKTFSFDATFDGSCTQQEVFEQTGAPIVDNVFEGYNGTIFCYGQTGSGKTHTMEGRSEPIEEKGIMPRAFKQVFDTIGIDDSGNKKYLVHASYLELYNEEVKDLLSKDPNQKLKIHENPDTGVYVEGLTSPIVKNIAEIDSWMQRGKTNRSTASTLMNATSSRSHSIFTIIVEQSDNNGVDGNEHIKVGKLNLVDLAGSERIAKTGAEGQTYNICIFKYIYIVV